MTGNVKNERLYFVSRYGSRGLHIYARDSAHAKRIYCKECGCMASDHWTGVSSLSARSLSRQEEAAWLDVARVEFETCVFLKGMLDICAKAYEGGGAEF